MTSLWLQNAGKYFIIHMLDAWELNHTLRGFKCWREHVLICFCKVVFVLFWSSHKWFEANVPTCAFNAAHKKRTAGEKKNFYSKYIFDSWVDL